MAKTSTRVLLASLTMLIATVSVAEDTCPNPKRIKNICMYVGDMTEDDTRPGKWRYGYQRRFYEAACVDVDRDSKEVRAEKISKLWQVEEERLICNNVQFDVGNGNLLKYGAIVQFDAFISDVIEWKVPLNKVDVGDGRTLLDYLQYHIERTRGGAMAKRWEFYYTELRKAGAKHRHELP